MSKKITTPAKKDYVILVAPAFPRKLLAAESDEDDGLPVTTPPWTSDSDHALIFSEFNAARDALRAAVRRFPANEFSIGTIPLTSSEVA